MTKSEIILSYLHEVREWLKMLLPPFLIGWHMNPPKWMSRFKKESDQEKSK